MSITCAMLAGALAAASPGDRIRIVDPEPCNLEIRDRRWAAPGVTVELAATRTRRMILRGVDGLTLVGGRYEGPGQGRDRGLDARGVRNLTVQRGEFTADRWALVCHQCEGLTIQDSVFRSRADGIALIQTQRFLIERNVFRDFNPVPTRCTIGEAVERGLSRNECRTRGGRWRDGDHPDAIQMWNTVRDGVIRHNRVHGQTMGFTTHGPAGDGHARIEITDNELHVSYASAIVLLNTDGGLVTRNRVVQIPGGRFRPNIRVDDRVTACGNSVTPPLRTRVTERCPPALR